MAEPRKRPLLRALILLAGELLGIHLAFLGLSAFVKNNTYKALEVFQNTTFSFSGIYLAWPDGDLPTRLIYILFGTLILWFVSSIMVMVLSRTLNMTAVEDFADTWLHRTIHTILILAVIGTYFFPLRLATFDVTNKAITLTDYRAIASIWPNPVPASSSNIEFNAIRDFRYHIRETKFMGTTFDEAILYAITDQDSLELAKAPLYHGDFGWMVDWRSRKEIIEDGQKEADSAIRMLKQIVGM